MREEVNAREALQGGRSAVVGVPIDAIALDGVLETIDAWGVRRESRMVCLCNVHSVVTAGQDAQFGDALKASDLNLPDGAPVAWVLRRVGFRSQRRVSGPDLMASYCQRAAGSGMPVFLYGGASATLEVLQRRLQEDYPGLRIVGAYSPPFRPLTEQEDEAVVEMINASGAGVVWVGLGCPKQEKWMAEHKGRIHAVMLGVGAAFDMHAGKVSRAPQWMRDNGLEWLHRLGTEPRRLWKRYLHTNSVFVWKVLVGFATRRMSADRAMRG